MCISFGARAPKAQVQNAAPIQPRQPDLVSAARLPSKKELLDPDETAEVAYGSGAKKGAPSAGKKTGTDALKINVNTGGTMGGGTGGLNV